VEQPGKISHLRVRGDTPTYDDDTSRIVNCCAERRARDLSCPLGIWCWQIGSRRVLDIPDHFT